MGVVAIKRRDNPFWPLPPDYLTLTGGGQRDARVNACRQWLINWESPADAGDALAAAVRFFDEYYLRPDEEADFDPLFYDMAPLESPPFHDNILRFWAQHRTTITIAPRGGSKSFLITKRMMTQMLTAPAYSFVYATSTHDNALSMGQRLKDQFFDNSRIFDDFAKLPEFEGKIKPTRGDAPLGTDNFQIGNRSSMRAVSVTSRFRGIRPRRFILDDPEFDPKASTSMSMIREYMETLIFKIAMPAVMRAETGLDWTATFVSKKHAAYNAMFPDESTESGARFKLWARLFVPGAYELPDGTLKSAWEEMWPSNDAERKRLNRPTAVTVPEMLARMGTAAFRAEFLGQPGTADDSYFSVDPNPTGKHAWWIEGAPDAEFSASPRKSSTVICWIDPKSLEVLKFPMSEFLRRVRLFMTVDTSYTGEATSDYKAVVLMGYWPQSNTLFVLDIWQIRGKEPALIKATFEMADRWLCPEIWPEAVKGGITLYQGLQAIVQTRATDAYGLKHTPKIVPLKPGMVDKRDRISASLSIRFEHGLIKLPVYKIATPYWRDLWTQVTDFNPEADSGGLKNDDLLDCTAMSYHVLRGRAARWVPNAEKESTPLEELKAGKKIDKYGQPNILKVDWAALPPEELNLIMEGGVKDGESRKSLA